MSADLELGLVYVPVEMPTGDYYGGNRPGNTLFGESLVALDIKTGKRKWHYQMIHHGLWDYDLPCAPILFDVTRERPARQGAGAADQAGVPVRPESRNRRADLADRRAAGAAVEVPGEKTSPTQPFPTRPAPFDRQGIGDRRSDRFHAGAARRGARGHQAVPDRPAVHAAGRSATPTARSRRCRCRRTPAARTGRAASFDPETNRLYIHSHTAVFADRHRAGQPRDVGHGLRVRARRARRERRAPAARRTRRRRRAARGGTTVQGLPLIKPPYDRITAYDMNTGDLIWQKTHSSTPDDIKNHPALKGLDLPRLGQPGRTFIGVLTTKTLLIAGEGGVHTQRGGRTRGAAARLRQGDRRRRRRRQHAGQADRIADDLHDQRQAVHRRRRQRRQRRGIDRLRPATVLRVRERARLSHSGSCPEYVRAASRSSGTVS